MDMAAPRTRRPRIALATLAAGALLLAACGDDEATPADTGLDDTAGASSGDDMVADLDDREFVSSEVEGHDLVAGSEIRLTFMGEELRIDAGCNSMGGAYTITDGILTAGQMFMTEMACEEPLMDQDAWVAEFLSAGAEVTLEAETLTLVGESATIVLVDREVAEPDLSLEGTEWTIEGLVSSDAVSSLVAGSPAMLLIEGDTASVDTGCNTATGPAEVDEAAATITFGPMATTRMACEPDLMDQESAILAVLDGAVTYEIESNRLALTNVADPSIGLALTTGP